MGCKSGDLAHPLTVLEDCGLIVREPDAFKQNRTSFRIAEPLLTFYHAVMRPIWADLEYASDNSRLWKQSQRRFYGSVLGPHFEQICQHWTRYMAPPELFGGYPNLVAGGTVNDSAGRITHQVDVAVMGLDDENRRPLLMVGEAKWGEVMGLGHLERLRRVRELLIAQKRHGAETARLGCFLYTRS